MGVTRMREEDAEDKARWKQIIHCGSPYWEKLKEEQEDKQAFHRVLTKFMWGETLISGIRKIQTR